MIDFKGNLDDNLSHIELLTRITTITIQMDPYEAHGRRCRPLFGWFEVGEAGFIGPKLVDQAMD